jgi:hypothetical protein
MKEMRVFPRPPNNKGALLTQTQPPHQKSSPPNQGWTSKCSEKREARSIMDNNVGTLCPPMVWATTVNGVKTEVRMKDLSGGSRGLYIDPT